jgi:hypothetical protein
MAFSLPIVQATSKHHPYLAAALAALILPVQISAALRPQPLTLPHVRERFI